MTPVEVVDIGRDALYLLLRCALPILLVAMIVGVVIGLLQAVTQIQEMTLTFVPKIIAVFLTIIIVMPYIITNIMDFTEELNARIIRVDE